MVDLHVLLRALKVAAEGLPVWAGGEPNVAPEIPSTTPDPYSRYIEGAMGAPRRRENVFDLATGTRWNGLRGLKERVVTGLGEHAHMMQAGVSPGDKNFIGNMTSAAQKHFETPGAIERTFGSKMPAAEALSTLGIKDLLGAKRLASDPLTWSQAFGKAAKTPGERARARKVLHAALSLNAAVKGLKFNKDKYGLVWAGVTPEAQRAMRVPRTPRTTSEGTQMLPDLKDLMAAPVLDPRSHPDNQTAADLMSKVSSGDPRAKIAAELVGAYGTAKLPGDPENHLYHVERRDGGTVGMVKVAPRGSGETYHITNFWVKPGLRSQGIGKALMARVLETYGDKVLTLDSEVFDDSPLTPEQLSAFYERHGFIKGEGQAMRRPAGGAEEKSAEEKSAGFIRGLMGRLLPGRQALRAQVPPRVPSANRVVARRAIASRLPALRQAFPAHAGRLEGAVGALQKRTIHERVQRGGFLPAPAARPRGFDDIQLGTPVMSPESRLELIHGYLGSRGFRAAPGMNNAPRKTT